jgi:hypothetical protein
VNAYIVRCAGGVPRTYETVHAVAQALLATDGPTEPITVLIADQGERPISKAELDHIRRAIPEARAALALEAEVMKMTGSRPSWLT